MTVMPQPADAAASDATPLEPVQPASEATLSTAVPVTTEGQETNVAVRTQPLRMYQPGHQDVGRIAQDLQIRKIQVESVAQLLDEGLAVPYIARFCKERIGFLNEDIIRQVQRRLLLLRQLNDRKQAILRNLQTQGKLTNELQSAIEGAETNKRLEDLYLPFKPRKKSPTNALREKGLEPLALAIWQRDPAVQNLEELWPTFVNPEKGLNSPEDVKSGVQVLIAEAMSETATVRETARRFLWEQAKWRIERSPQLAEGQGQEFKDYFSFSDSIRHLAPHRVFTILRGEKAGALTIHLDCSWEQLAPLLLEKLKLADHPHHELVNAAAVEGMRSFLMQSLEKEIRRDLMEKAEEYGLQVYARNFRRLLMQPPVHKSVLAIDPGYRNGCRLAALDMDGQFLAQAVVYPMAALEKERKEAKKNKGEPKGTTQKDSSQSSTEPTKSEPSAESTSVTANATHVATNGSEAIASTNVDTVPATSPAGPTPDELRVEAKKVIIELVRKHQLQVAAIGSGMGSRDVEELFSELIASELPDLEYHVVLEAGANAYALGSVGREEFPQLEVAARAAITIGRRLQDPLSEFAKIDPVHVSAGLAHYDLPEKRLKEALTAVLESCINQTGVDLNRSTVHELKYIAGLNPLLAQAIVQHRQQHGPFPHREALKQIEGLTEQIFRQAAAFVRVPNSDRILDRTWIHPDHTEIANELLTALGFNVEALQQEEQLDRLRQQFAELNLEEWAQKYQISPVLLDDILHALARPGKDSRMDQPAPVMKKKLLKLEDMFPGMELKGTVLNVVDFGAFVDVGLKDSGLVHISQLANKYIKSPYDHVSVGDVVTVWVMNIDMDRKRISLTMIPPGTDRKPLERKTTPIQRERREPVGDRGTRTPKPRFPAQIATPGKPSPAKSHSPRPAARQGAEQVQRSPNRQTTTPRKNKPTPKLSDEALKGATPLRTFSELKALYEAKKPGSDAEASDQAKQNDVNPSATPVPGTASLDEPPPANPPDAE